MTKHFRFFILVLCIAFITIKTNAQTVYALNAGWNVAHLFKPLSNLETTLYRFNLQNPDIVKKYSMPDYFQGPYFDFRVGGPRGGMILGWANKHAIAKAEGIATGSGDSLYQIRNVKARLNVFSWGYYFSLYKRLKMAMTYDFGSFKILKKIAPKDEFKSANWEKMYDQKGVGTIGVTINISYPIPLGKRFQLRFQPYAQYVLLYKNFTFTSGSVVNKYYYNPSNYGLNMFLSFLWGRH